MQYLLLVANSPDNWDDPGPSDGDEVYEDWAVYSKALHEAGVLVSGAGLHDPDMATSVRVKDGETLLADAPFADIKEHIIGFYLIETPDLDTALAWAARMPNARTGVTEVRPVRGELQLDASLSVDQE